MYYVCREATSYIGFVGVNVREMTEVESGGKKESTRSLG